MNATDASAAVFGTLISLLLAAAVYVWLSIALSAVFRKSGVEPWKAWVPILNLSVLLQLGGFSPWLVLLSLVPIVNLAFVVVLAIALYRVNVAFGYGVGMTVLGVLLLPAWATVIGFGSARWVGRESTVGSAERPRHGFDPDAGPRRMGGGRDGLPPLPSFAPSAPGASGAASRPTLDPRVWGFAPPETPAAAPTPAAPEPALAVPEAPGMNPGLATAAEAGAPEGRPTDPTPSAGEAPGVPETYETRARPAAAPWSPPPGSAESSGVGDAVSPQPAPGPAPIPSTVGPPEGGWTPPPLPGARRGQSEWEGFGVESTDHSEVTGAFTGAPAPVSAVPPVPAVPPIPALLVADDVGASGPTPATDEASPKPRHPPVTRVPAAEAGRGVNVGTDDGEPWAPARSPMGDTGAFPESSGAVSAVAGAPDAGSPRAARGAVSAQHAKPEIPDDVFDETIISHRRRTEWSLVPPTGDPIAIGSEVVILGRRPSPDPAHPGAQLISIQDGTVSKTHARLELRGDRWYVTDLGSTNGVLFATLMGTEVEAPPGEQVEAGDRFLLGDAEVRLVRSEA
jgi:hypothetical protein